MEQKHLSVQEADMTSSVRSQANPQLKTAPIASHLCLGEIDIFISWFLYLKNGHKSHISWNDYEDQVVPFVETPNMVLDKYW